MFKRLKNLIRGFFSLFISGLEANNPEALIEAEKENLRIQISRFNENLANHAAFMERLMRQVKKLTRDEKQLTAKIMANMKVGNTKVAGQLALQLQTIKQQLEENQLQLDGSEKTFKDLEKSRDISIREAKSKIDKLTNLVGETEMMEAQAELQEMAKGMIAGIGDSGDTVNRVTSLLEERRDKAAGKARVSSSSYDTSSIELKEGEQDALGDAALAEFAAMNGMGNNVEPAEIVAETPRPASPNKEMGPMN